MNKRKTWLTAALLCAVSAPAIAANWEICDLKVEVGDKQTVRHELQAHVLESQAKGQAECPQAGTALSFRPETVDYQSELPRRQWPKPGTKVKVRYGYLDGI